MAGGIRLYMIVRMIYQWWSIIKFQKWEFGGVLFMVQAIVYTYQWLFLYRTKSQPVLRTLKQPEIGCISPMDIFLIPPIPDSKKNGGIVEFFGL